MYRYVMSGSYQHSQLTSVHQNTLPDKLHIKLQYALWYPRLQPSGPQVYSGSLGNQSSQHVVNLTTDPRLQILGRVFSSCIQSGFRGEMCFVWRLMRIESLGWSLPIATILEIGCPIWYACLQQILVWESLPQ